MQVIDHLSLCSVPLVIGFEASGHEEERLGTGTGFFWKSENRTFLVSNWHVFAGRDPRTGQPKDAAGAIPNRLTVVFRPRHNINRPFPVQFALNDQLGNNFWLQHKRHGQDIDVAALEITSMTQNAAAIHEQPMDPLCVNDAEQVDGIATPMGSDVFIVGYPLGIPTEGKLPIWKRGSIASEPALEVGKLPCFLVDTATREGMSGSPVYARAFGGSYSTKSGAVRLIRGTVSEFIGVYSGRYVGALGEAHLGIVWRPSLINEVIADPTPGAPIIREAAAPKEILLFPHFPGWAGRL
jgi:hypothetical protein